MNIKILFGIIVLAIIMGVGALALSSHHGTSGALINTTSNQTNSALSTVSTNSSKILFSTTQYAQYSYLVYPGQISQQAQAALTGFNMTATMLQNSSTEVRLALIGTSQYKSLILKPNYELYIIEIAFGDDGYHFDSSLGDDGFVVVDPNGYVVQ
jgi:hypothetical protein